MDFKTHLRLYYHLTKPGIIYGNLVTAAAGFAFASKGKIDWQLFVEAMLGIAFVIASACVFNNYLDRGIDRRMSRTQKRALADNRISPANALIFGSILGIVGLALLAVLVNNLVAVLAAVAELFYVAVYGWAKRNSIHGALIGSIPGAAPPVMGYCAVTNHLDSAALILFLILVTWQMPHFYGIALYRKSEYKSAKVPVMPLKVGDNNTKIQTLLYMLAFIAAGICLWLFGYASIVYAIIISLAGFYWFWVALKNWHAASSQWGKRIFISSLVINLITAVTIGLNWWLAKL